MSKLSKKDVLKLASLSQLELSEEELQMFTKDINAILSYVEMLQSVPTEGIEPTYQVTGLTNIYREDVVNEKVASVGRESLLKNAPGKQDGQFKVKRVIE